MAKLPYREGTLFAVPLRRGGYVIGLVARSAPRGRIILVYLFGPKRSEIPNLKDISTLQRKDAIRCLRVGDLGLINGDWRIIGELDAWRKEDWPMPRFVDKNDLSKKVFISTYADSDPSELERHDPAPLDIVGLEPDGLHGYGAVELLMTKQLDGNNVL
ncbi:MULTISPECIES: Imm26 family immunity protein [unclassified Mesorhizobium]|uniref:Imm26 family immunity protein n=1 Tax=unclassified Mesorhizobium TaxID=325217 RepID=UPI000FCAC95B|nr:MULTISPECIES: Imm26 family immunity protein [unclassified Mesorhizobium]RUZ84002.1 hypothetical protein EN947_14975 [Mesorhizobium sp. M7A.F.Ca.US.003.02.2.1]MBZ9722125.1 immunity 26/phosphotriesterase HocA family protein [Mesorhizobium sp. AD1-1]RUY87206.1 hypothetical protein EN974_32900 [Mesorhizobium sp. M7A.F.Ca.CA.001.12.2.1]RUZ16557.1 hypothetical protein EN949_31325 [Mesorhizobium sp. M7A.F.Ca.US.007.01.2.1]RUZ46933.1 hypothetical protein EN948_13800 [Mesorhizobium sp. M7A.F.Ca.US.0